VGHCFVTYLSLQSIAALLQYFNLLLQVLVCGIHSALPAEHEHKRRFAQGGCCKDTSSQLVRHR
jgi:hypothetical protein